MALTFHRSPTSGPIFPPNSAIPQCHASTLAQLPDGRFVAACFGGSREQAPDTAIYLFHRDLAQWSAPRRLFKISDLPHWNPVLFLDPDSTLHLWFKVGPDCARWKTFHAASIDGGETWSTPSPLLHDHLLPRGPVRCPPLLTAGGTLLAGASDELTPDPYGHAWWPFIDRSTDRGQTWTPIPIALPATATGKGAIQPTLWQSAPSRVHCFLRTGFGRIYRSDSSDDGQTWSPAYPTDLPNNNCSIAAAKLHTGHLALVYNPTATTARTPLRLSLSPDNGETWTHHLDLATGEGEFSYPTAIPTAVGLAITWTNKRTSISFWHAPIEAIPPSSA